MNLLMLCCCPSWSYYATSLIVVIVGGGALADGNMSIKCSFYCTLSSRAHEYQQMKQDKTRQNQTKQEPNPKKLIRTQNPELLALCLIYP